MSIEATLDNAHLGLSCVGATVQGNPVTIPTGDAALSAIDTGTTLIGGPSDAVRAIYEAIPGSAEVSSMQGFYAFREHPISIRVSVAVIYSVTLRSLFYRRASIFGLRWQVMAH